MLPYRIKPFHFLWLPWKSNVYDSIFRSSRVGSAGLIPGQGTKVSHVLSHVQLFATPWTVAYQDPLSVWYFRQEYWSGLLLPTPGDLPDPEIKLVSPALAGGFSTTELPRNFSISHAARQKKKKTEIQKGLPSPIGSLLLICRLSGLLLYLLN